MEPDFEMGEKNILKPLKDKLLNRELMKNFGY
jgi:hypothetical protein